VAKAGQLNAGNPCVTVTWRLLNIEGDQAMRCYEATSTINAGPEAVWPVLSETIEKAGQNHAGY
jgi:hypothetical protein